MLRCGQGWSCPPSFSRPADQPGTGRAHSTPPLLTHHASCACTSLLSPFAQGSLLAPSATDPVAAPGVLPWLPTLAASWYASARAIGPPPAQPVRIQAGPEGAWMLVCPGSAAVPAS